VLVGIQRRGVPLAHRFSKEMQKIRRSSSLPVGKLDITLYRDDLDTIADQPIVRSTDIPVEVTGKTVILIDDVLYTGRTVRAALNEIMEFGRPKLIRLVALVERSGYRELPISADFVGIRVKTKPDESIDVHLEAVDQEDGVFIKSIKGK